MSDADAVRLLTALALLLSCATIGGRLFARFRQPPVIGEILGGLVLGPTGLGLLAPGVSEWLFPAAGASPAALSLVFQLGLLLLMFLSGAQMRRLAFRDDPATIGFVLVMGTLVPFAAGVLIALAVPSRLLLGPAGVRAALILVVAAAVAVTSIPVISRIFLDLGMLDTRLARVVLAIAVVEDVVLNVVVAIALGLVGGAHREGLGLQSLLGIDAEGAGAVAYHAIVPVVFLVAILGLVPRVRRRLSGSRPISTAPLLVCLLGVSGLCLFLGVAPMLGAFAAGLVAGGPGGAHRPRRTGQARGDDPTGTGMPPAVGTFSTSFFVPLYFASVGLRLNLAENLDVPLTIGFLAAACVVKATSAYTGARLARNPPSWSFDLAVAVNARGGPGIVFATLAYDAGIVSAPFFTTLILTAVLTSLIAGSWLERVASRHRPATLDPPPGSGAAPAVAGLDAAERGSAAR